MPAGDQHPCQNCSHTGQNPVTPGGWTSSPGFTNTPPGLYTWPYPAVVNHIHKEVKELPDSLEIGTAGKGGNVKIYFDGNKPDEAELKIRNIFMLRRMAQELAEGVEPTHTFLPTREPIRGSEAI